VISARTSLTSLASLVLPVALILFGARSAHAQTHWDANVQVGGSARLFSNSGYGGLPGSLGPVVAVAADVAIIPLLRIGLYGDYEYADTTEPAPSSVVSFGGRLKLMLPGNRNHVHWWLFTGVGAVVWQAPGYVTADPNSSTGISTVTPASGYFAEIPLGVGMGWRVRKPWEIVAELQGRFGFDMNGSYFGQNAGFSNPDDQSSLGASRPTTSSSGAGSIPTGSDVFAVLLTVGVGLDE
jgi:hypothetical protein